MHGSQEPKKRHLAHEFRHQKGRNLGGGRREERDGAQGRIRRGGGKNTMGNMSNKIASPTSCMLRQALLLGFAKT